MNSAPYTKKITEARAEHERLTREHKAATATLATARTVVTAAEGAYAESETDARWRAVASARDGRDRAELSLKNLAAKCARADDAVREAERDHQRAKYRDACTRSSRLEFLRTCGPEIERVLAAHREATAAMDALGARRTSALAAADEARALAKQLGETFDELGAVPQGENTAVPGAPPTLYGWFLASRVAHDVGFPPGSLSALPPVTSMPVGHIRWQLEPFEHAPELAFITATASRFKKAK